MTKRAEVIWMISRKHPPGVGGMEIMSWHLVRGIGARRAVVADVWRHSQRALPLFMLAAAVRLMLGLLRGRVRVVHLGDPALAPLGWLAFAARVPVVVTAHGLDLVYPNPAYQWLLARTLPRCAAMICISAHVRDIALARGLAPAALRVIPVGIAPGEVRAADIAADAVKLGMMHGDAVILLVGRLIPRKGFAWFLQEVFGPLARARDRLHCVVIGAGPERTELDRIVSDNGLAGRAHLLGSQPEARKWGWLARASLLAVPNVQVAGDVEGFGIVALEGALAGKPVVAARIEGLLDAVREGVTGWLLPSGDAAAWVSRLSELLDDPETLAATGGTARNDVLTRCTWDRITDEYCDVLDRVSLAA